MNPAQAGGPVGGNMMMMADAGGAVQAGGTEKTRVQLNTYIYEYFLKIGLHDVARALHQQQDKFKIMTKPKQSPGRRKDGEANGVEPDAMDVDKFDIPDDLPLPDTAIHLQGDGFLVDWFSIFSDLFVASRITNKNSMGPSQQYLMHAQVRSCLRVKIIIQYTDMCRMCNECANSKIRA